MSRNPATQTKFQASAPALPSSLVGALAEFFPDAVPLHLPVRVEMENGTAEQAIIEFGTTDEVMFSSCLPLEFGDRVTVSNSDGSLVAETQVVALQFHAGEAAVAARFSHRVPNWIVKR